jgi:hypothetical protein
MLSPHTSFNNINRQYTARKYNELHAILQDAEQWREFQDFLQGRTQGITNSSVKENLLTLLRTKSTLKSNNSTHRTRRENYLDQGRELSIPSMCSSTSSSSSLDGSVSSDDLDL